MCVNKQVVATLATREMQLQRRLKDDISYFRCMQTVK